jgi:DNA helicase MCM9
VRKEDRGSIHEAMEQQTISVAKGGMVCKIQTRTTILAACNPIQSKSHLSDLSKSTGIMSSLLSRFDLIFLQPDIINPSEELAKIEFCLTKNSVSHIKNTKLWSSEKLAKYIAFVNSIFEPNLTQAAEEVFKAYYAHVKNR